MMEEKVTENKATAAIQEAMDYLSSKGSIDQEQLAKLQEALSDYQAFKDAQMTANAINDQVVDEVYYEYGEDSLEAEAVESFRDEVEADFEALDQDVERAAEEAEKYAKEENGKDVEGQISYLRKMLEASREDTKMLKTEIDILRHPFKHKIETMVDGISWITNKAKETGHKILDNVKGFYEDRKQDIFKAVDMHTVRQKQEMLDYHKECLLAEKGYLLQSQQKKEAYLQASKSLSAARESIKNIGRALTGKKLVDINQVQAESKFFNKLAAQCDKDISWNNVHITEKENIISDLEAEIQEIKSRWQDRSKEMTPEKFQDHLREVEKQVELENAQLQQEQTRQQNQER